MTFVLHKSAEFSVVLEALVSSIILSKNFQPTNYIPHRNKTQFKQQLGTKLQTTNKESESSFGRYVISDPVDNEELKTTLINIGSQ